MDNSLYEDWKMVDDVFDFIYDRLSLYEGLETSMSGNKRCIDNWMKLLINRLEQIECYNGV